MLFMCLLYEDEKAWEALPEAEMNQVFGEYIAFTDDVRKSGHLVHGEPLEPTPTAKTVRVRRGQPSVVDGPFAETKEQLGGFYLIEAKDMEEATKIAARIPCAKSGCVEVRPVLKLPM